MSVLGSEQPLPYCGAPPDPISIWHRWNLDPLLFFFITSFAILYFVAARRSGAARSARMAFAAGWVIGAFALMSPLCPLSVSLFAARVGQHMVLTLIAAPLVALGRPDRLVPGRLAAWFSRSPLAASAVFAVLLWFWHSPAPYAATFASTLVYWSMHISLIAAAVWLWLSLLAEGRRPMAVIAAGLFSSVQMGFLGALITLASRAVYTPHLLTTAAWGLSPLQDQQLGGAIMWVPGCLVFLAAAMWTLARLLGRFDWSDGRRPAAASAGA
jgi:putative membrane protein